MHAPPLDRTPPGSPSPPPTTPKPSQLVSGVCAPAASETRNLRLADPDWHVRPARHAQAGAGCAVYTYMAQAAILRNTDGCCLIKTRQRQFLHIWLYLAKANQVKPRTVPVGTNSGCPDIRTIPSPARPNPKREFARIGTRSPPLPPGVPLVSPTEVNLRGSCDHFRGRSQTGLAVVCPLNGILGITTIGQIDTCASETTAAAPFHFVDICRREKPTTPPRCPCLILPGFQLPNHEPIAMSPGAGPTQVGRSLPGGGGASSHPTFRVGGQQWLSTTQDLGPSPGWVVSTTQDLRTCWS